MNQSPQSDEQHEPQAPLPTSAGARLAAMRQERGWTVEQVASQLNLAPRQVVAIENDDYPALPGMPIVRGFVRAYAKLLKEDPAPLLALIGGETVLMQEPVSSRKSLSTPFSEARVPSMMARDGNGSKWLFGGLALVLLGVAVWAFQKSGNLDDVSKSASTQMKDGLAYLSGANGEQAASTSAGQPQQAAVPPVSAATETTAAPAAAGAASESSASASGGSQPAPTESPAAGASTQTSATGTAAPAPNATPALPATATAKPSTAAAPDSAAATAAHPAAVEATAAAKNPLVFTARQDSWIEVRRSAGNAVVLSRVVKAGETETVNVAEPVSVVIGNAAGVQATLRGAPLEIKPAGGNVARLTVK